MTIDVINSIPYLRTSREYPEDLHQLCVEVNRSYLDIANKVNARTIGLFTTNRAAVTGESWYLSKNQRQQSFRQVFIMPSLATFKHNLDTSGISTFTVIRGVAYDGTNWYPLPFSNNAAGGQVELYVSPTQIVINTGGAPPGFVSGFILLEWLSNV